MKENQDCIGAVAGLQTSNEAMRFVLNRLDHSLPLETEDWARVEQMIARLSEFAPDSILMELASAVVNYADDQAYRGYVLGRQDSQSEQEQLSERNETKAGKPRIRVA